MLNTSECLRDLTLLRLRLLLQRQSPGCQRGPAVSVAGAAGVLEKKGAWHSPVRPKASQRHSKRILLFFSFFATYTRRKNAANTTLC